MASGPQENGEVPSDQWQKLGATRVNKGLISLKYPVARDRIGHAGTIKSETGAGMNAART